MKNLIYLTLLFCLFSTTVEAQGIFKELLEERMEEKNKPAATQSAQMGTTGVSASASSSNQNFVNIRNRWKGSFIHVEYGDVEASSLGKNGWHSGQWTFELGKDGYKMIKNRWKNSYLRSNNGKLEASSSVGPGSQSAHWSIIRVSGTNFYKLQNRLTKTFLHTENGKIALGAIEEGWHSAQWENATVKADVPVNYDGPRAMMYFRYTDQVQGGGGLNLKVGSQIIVLPNQTVKNAHGISFDPNKPRICGMKFTIASMSPMRFTEPFPENMRDTNNNSFAFEVVQVK